MLIKLSDGCWVSADEIAEVKVNDQSSTITVRMKSGIGHNLNADYGIGVYATADKLIEKINGLLKKVEGG